MLTKDAIAHFGNSQAELARALNIRPQSVADWGAIVPPLRQIQIEKITRGKLKADASIFGPAPVRAERVAS